MCEDPCPVQISAIRWTVLSAFMFLLAGCRHDWGKADDLSRRVKCGMTEPQIRALANDMGVSRDRVWRQQPNAPNVITVEPRQLDFIDVLLQGGQAVAVQRGNYVAFTTAMDFGEIRMLCGAAPIAARTLRDYDEMTEVRPR